MKKQDKNNKKDKNKDDAAGKRTFKIVVMILIIIIIILLLLTSCSSVSFGKIGNIFRSSSRYDITDNSGERKRVYNKELKFINKTGSTFIGDEYKIEFTTDKLNSKKYKCTTSDSKIATCTVKKNYVIVKAKKSGKVKISVIVEMNGHKYIGTHDLTVKKINRSITLDSSNGTIDLNENKNISIYYTLNNLSGNVSVTSSNSKVATATAKNGVLTVTGHKNGKATLTLTVKYNGKKYSAKYDVTITTSNKNNNNNNNNTNSNSSTSNNKGGTGSTSGEDKPNNPTNPDKPDKPSVNKSDINTLKSLSIKDFNINPSFSSNENNYSVDVNYNTQSIELINVKLTDNKSTIKYKLGNKTITDINNIKLSEGSNELKIIVTSESGKTNTYTININKPVRTINIDKSKTDIYIDDGTTDIIYNVFENNNLTNTYNLDDISVDIPGFRGTINISNNIVSITPSTDDIGKSFDLNIKYLNNKDKVRFNVKTRYTYYINTNTDVYNFVKSSSVIDQNIIINTNIFNNDVSLENITNGIKLSNSTGGYITIKSRDINVLKLKYNESDNSNVTNSVSIATDIVGSGSVFVDIEGNINNQVIGPITIKVNITEKFNIIIDALDGFYDAFTTKYELIKEHDEIIDLSSYIAYKVDKDNCIYYELVKYNTKPDGTGDDYELGEITVDRDLTLYAVYRVVNDEPDIPNTMNIPLTNVDIFHNEAYYKKYNKDKIIYPGAYGDHQIDIKNNTSSKIKITNLYIDEKNICVTTPVSGCINMGYIIKYTRSESSPFKYWYGDNNSYKILNIDAGDEDLEGYKSIAVPNNNSRDNEVIELEPGEGVTISLLWKWEEVNDKLDTAIGNMNGSREYSIIVSLDYEKEVDYCAP